ncbi:type II secretion system F family protein [Candidatus Soleaferrea massiliensis]|uniref:type II secretion system F family protein n=1 Tax=Candidatus Soleaferrea massiliensis TaxID=1470354 RepID=UPI00069344D1|nr:hypothetical protein [Candidatus Soleaferrea massiliensis]
MKKKKLAEQPTINSPLHNPMLNYSVYVMSRAEGILVRLAAFVVGGLTGLVFYGGLFKIDGFSTWATHISNMLFFAAAGLLAMKLVLPIYKKRRLEKRSSQLKTQFRDMLKSLVASFSSGSNVRSAFEAALGDLKMQYSDKDFIVREMQEIVDGIDQNISVEIMLRNFGDRSGNEDILSFADVFEICYRKGGDMRFIIHRTYSVISEKIAVSDEIETKLTSNKMQHNVMSVMPIAVVALLRLTNESFAANFATPTGVIVNTIAIGVFIGAYKFGLKIVDIKG